MGKNGKVYKIGGEAATVAVRLARAFTNRDKLAICGYHGWHDWYGAANLNSKKITKWSLVVKLFTHWNTKKIKKYYI